MPQDLFKIAQTCQGGGYLTFCVSTIKKIIVSINTFNMFFSIATTSFPDLLSVGGWHNRPAFTLFSVLPYRKFRQNLLYYNFSYFSIHFSKKYQVVSSNNLIRYFYFKLYGKLCVLDLSTFTYFFCFYVLL